LAYRNDISALGADHHWIFDGNSNDNIGTANGVDTTMIYTDAAISKDATNCATTDALTDRITLPTTITINNSAQARKAIAGWFETTAYQAPPTRIYGEGTQLTCFQFCMGFGNNLIFEVTEPTNFATGLQIYGLALIPNRVYHLCAIFSGNAYDNLIKLFVDGVLQTDADPVARQPNTASLDSRGVGEFGDAVGTTGLGGGVVLQQASRNGRYQHWAAWGDTVNALLTDTEVRVTLFERGALAQNTITTGTQVAMQTSVDSLSNQINAPCCVEVEAVTGGGNFQLTSPITYDSKASIHVRYNGIADTLTWVNTSGGNASIGSAPFGGTLIIATRQTLTITVKDATDKTAISGARVYMKADVGGDLAVGTVIMNTTTNISGVATISYDYTNDQPIIAYVRKGSVSKFYSEASIDGPLTSTPFNAIVLMVLDE